MKPTFILSKGQRNEQGTIYTGDMVQHYRDAAGGLYRWDGLPDGCPADFIESTALFYSGGVGAKKVKGFGNTICPIKPSTLTFYGRPYSWYPESISGTMPIDAADDYFTESNGPSLWLNTSIYDRIEPYLHIMEQTMKVLHVNIFGLTQPVMLSGQPQNMNTLLLKSDLLEGVGIIPITDKTAIPPEVLDLHAQDHTANLISTMDWCDARILEIMASSNGVEKSSGITTMETVSGVQSVLQQMDIGLDMRKAWADECNDKLKMDLSVSLGKGASMLTQTPASTEQGPEVDDDE